MKPAGDVNISFFVKKFANVPGRMLWRETMQITPRSPSVVSLLAC